MFRGKELAILVIYESYVLFSLQCVCVVVVVG